MFYRQPRK